jgi:hypothetical protein
MYKIRKVLAATKMVVPLIGDGTSGYNGENIPGTSAKISQVSALWMDTSGNLFFADSNSNYRIRKWTFSTGQVHTIAGNGIRAVIGPNTGPATSISIDIVSGVVGDTFGNIFIAEGSMIRMISSTGILSTYAGSGQCCYNGEGVAATSTQIDQLKALRIDSSGNIYFSASVRIRKIDRISNTVSTVVGSGLRGYSGDGGDPLSAAIVHPDDFWIDSNNDFYLPDTTAHRVRKVASSIITTMAGNGFITSAGDGGPAKVAQLSSPHGTFVDSIGNVYIADSGNCRVRMVDANGIISTFGGTGQCFITSDSGDGRASSSTQLFSPLSIWGDTVGNLYLATYGRIRKIKALDTLVSTVAGGGSSSAEDIPGTDYAFQSVAGIWGDTNNNLFITDVTRNTIKKLSPTFQLCTVAGNGVAGFLDNVAATSGQLHNPQGVWVNSFGVLFIADADNRRIRKVENGSVTTYAGTGSSSFNGDGRVATQTNFVNPSSVMGDSEGNIYVVDQFAYRIRMISSLTTLVTTIIGKGLTGFIGGWYLARDAPIDTPYHVTLDSNGNFYVCSGDRVVRTFLLNAPTGQPSGQPLGDPSSQPSQQPSSQPTRKPFSRPSSQPSRAPSGQPTFQPTHRPTSRPTEPTTRASSRPSVGPSMQPTNRPSRQPTAVPSHCPSLQPIGLPTNQPSSKPSGSPSVHPTRCPSSQPSHCPSNRPSVQPTAKPSSFPSSVPTLGPTNRPSCPPSSQPSNQPSKHPSSQPTSVPTAFPSAQPSFRPSSLPSGQPSVQPTVSPSNQPTTLSSLKPSTQPTNQPTALPSFQPTALPSIYPSSQPSRSPYFQPTMIPSTTPSALPSSFPTSQSSGVPSSQPTNFPSTHPTTFPTIFPSSRPTRQPSVPPSSCPSVKPSGFPTNRPSSQPSTKPSQQPSSFPSAFPSLQPTVVPTTQPNDSPTGKPHTFPSSVPSSPPSDQPTTFPSSSPSHQPTTVPSKQPFSPPTSRPTLQPTTTPTAQPFSHPTASPVASIYLSKGVLFYPGDPIYSNEVGSEKSNEIIGDSYVLFGRDVHSSGKFPFFISLDYPERNVFVSPLKDNSSGITAETVTRSTTVIGDINNDGFLDLMIGLPMESRCLVYLGTSFGVETVESFVIIGDPEQGGGQLGWASTRAGDWNHDGFDEIVVAAPYGNSVYFIFGKAEFKEDIIINTLQPSDGFEITGSQADTTFGVTLSLVHDFNKDGFQDLAIAAVRPGGANIIYILLGHINFGSTDIQIDSLLASNNRNCFQIFAPYLSYAGYSIAGIGDINNDGYNDLSIGSIPINNAKYTTQKTFIVYGRDIQTKTDLHLSQMTEKDGFIISGGGFLVQPAGDVNSDGVVDMMITRYDDWKGKGNAYLINYPTNVTYSPTFQPSSVPSNTLSANPSVSYSSIFPTSLPSSFPISSIATNSSLLFPPNQINQTISVRTAKPSFKPTRIPSFRPSQTPLPSLVPSIASTQMPSRTPTSIRIAPTEEATSKRKTSSPSPLHLRSALPSTPTNPPTLTDNRTPITSNATDFAEIECLEASNYFGGHNQTNTKFSISANSGTVSITGNDVTGATNLYLLQSCPSELVIVVIKNFRLSTDVISVAHLSNTDSGLTYWSLNQISYSLKSGKPLTLLFCSKNKLQVILSSHSSFSLTESNFLFSDLNKNQKENDHISLLGLIQIGIAAAVIVVVFCFVSISKNPDPMKEIAPGELECIEDRSIMYSSSNSSSFTGLLQAWEVESEENSESINSLFLTNDSNNSSDQSNSFLLNLLDGNGNPQEREDEDDESLSSLFSEGEEDEMENDLFDDGEDIKDEEKANYDDHENSYTSELCSETYS